MAFPFLPFAGSRVAIRAVGGKFRVFRNYFSAAQSRGNSRGRAFPTLPELLKRARTRGTFKLDYSP